MIRFYTHNAKYDIFNPEDKDYIIIYNYINNLSLELNGIKYNNIIIFLNKTNDTQC